MVLKDFLQNSLSEGEEKPGLQPSGALILSSLNLKKVLPLFISGILFSSPFGRNRCWKILVREMAKLMIYKPLQRRSSAAFLHGNLPPASRIQPQPSEKIQEKNGIWSDWLEKRDPRGWKRRRRQG